MELNCSQRPEPNGKILYIMSLLIHLYTLGEKAPAYTNLQTITKKYMWYVQMIYNTIVRFCK